MSLFSRLLLGFLVAVIATVAAQAIFAAVDPDSRLAPRLLLARGRLVHEQGQAALAQWEHEGDAAGLDRLKALSDTGLDVWLVTRDKVLGEHPIPATTLKAARRAIRNGSDKRSLLLWIDVLRPNEAVMAVDVPSASSRTRVIRIGFLILMPVLVCYGLSRWIYAPIGRLQKVAHSLGQGDLSVRAGLIQGYREAQELAGTFDGMADRIQGMIETQSRMLADVSHEIRSPLARIRLATEMARRGDVAKYLDRIERDVARLDKLVAALSTVVKTGQEPVSFEEIDLAALVTDVVGRFESQPGPTISTIIRPAKLTGDRRLLHSAAENLIRNAIAHSPPSGVIKVELSDGPPTLTVSDQGPGVPPEDLERIFEPFYRVSEARDRNTGGIGLGLAIVARVAHLHGGTVKANNLPEGGLEVTLSLTTRV